MKKNMSAFIILTLLLSFANLSCNSSKKVQGVIIGSTIGGVAGAALMKKNKAVGIILGAAIGGVGGGLIGSYMDKQAKDIARDLGKVATVTRVGEGIVVSFTSGLLFNYDSYALRSTTQENLQKLAVSLQNYKETEVNVLGHTDNIGSSDYNNILAANRAKSVGNYIASLKVNQGRIFTKGYGETDPVADNDSKEGRQLNRRVEIVIIADQNLKNSAAKGKIN